MARSSAIFFFFSKNTNVSVFVWITLRFKAFGLELPYPHLTLQVLALNKSRARVERSGWGELAPERKDFSCLPRQPHESSRQQWQSKCSLRVFLKNTTAWFNIFEVLGAITQPGHRPQPASLQRQIPAALQGCVPAGMSAFLPGVRVCDKQLPSIVKF